MTLLGILAAAAEAVVEGDVGEFYRLEQSIDGMMITSGELRDMMLIMGVLGNAMDT